MAPGKSIGKGKGKAYISRHKPNTDVIERLTKPAIRRILRRAGVKRMSAEIYPKIRECLKVRTHPLPPTDLLLSTLPPPRQGILEPVCRDTLEYTQNGRRKTITSMDVIHGLKNQNIKFYDIVVNASHPGA